MSANTAPSSAHVRPPLASRTLSRAALATLAAGALVLLGAEAMATAETPGATEPAFRPGGDFPVLAERGAWNWCQDPKAITATIPTPRTYAGWVDEVGNVVAACYDHASRSVTTHVLHDSLEVDDHDNPAFLMWPDGRLSAFYTPHGGVRISPKAPAMFCATTAFPGEFTRWAHERTIPANTTGSWGWTYPNACWLSDEGDCGRAYLFWRGGNGAPAMSYSEDGVDWSRAVSVLASAGIRPYMKAVSNGINAIHLVFTDGHPRGEPANSIYYVCYQAGSFFRADGTHVCYVDQLPMSTSSIDLVYDGHSEGGPSWIWDVAVNGDGHPVVAFATFPSVTDHRYRYATWSGIAWGSHEICSAGGWIVDVPEGPPNTNDELWYSGGIALDHSDPRRVYLSRPVDGTYEIEEWFTPDQGRSWLVAPVTSGSAQDNTRPVVPREHVAGGPDVLWLNGDYRHYRDYDTSARMRIP